MPSSAASAWTTWASAWPSSPPSGCTTTSAQTIARVFGCRVANGYGGRDAGFIAHECPQRRHAHHGRGHRRRDRRRPTASVLPPGQAGEIVVTHLATQRLSRSSATAPATSACSTTSRCACGRGLPLLKEIQGRTTDFVVAADGTVMHGLALIYVLRDLPGVEAVQDRAGKPRLHDADSAGARRQLRSAALASTSSARPSARLGAEVQVDVEQVADISTREDPASSATWSAMWQPAQQQERLQCVTCLSRSIVFGSLPFILKRPFWGIMLLAWLGYMNPHKLAMGSC